MDLALLGQIGAWGIACLCNMLPIDPFYDQADCRLRHSEFASKSILTDCPSCVPSADLNHFTRSDFANFLSFRIAPFHGHIGHVVSLCSKEQMGRIYAARNVTTVTDLYIVANRPVGTCIGNAMSKKIFDIWVVEIDDPVSAMSWTAPQNAAVVIHHAGSVFHKSLLQWDAARRCLALIRTKPPAAISESSFQWEEGIAASFAIVGDLGTFCPRHVGPPYRFGVFRAGPQLDAAGPIVIATPSFCHKMKRAGFIFWLLMILWFVFGLYWNSDQFKAGNYGIFGGNLLLFILLFLLGWKVFGFVIQGA